MNPSLPITLSYAIDFKTVKAAANSTVPASIPSGFYEHCIAEDCWPRTGTYLYIFCPNEKTAREYHEHMRAWRRDRKDITHFSCEMRFASVSLPV